MVHEKAGMCKNLSLYPSLPSPTPVFSMFNPLNPPMSNSPPFPKRVGMNEVKVVEGFPHLVHFIIDHNLLLCFTHTQCWSPFAGGLCSDLTKNRSICHPVEAISGSLGALRRYIFNKPWSVS